MDFDDITFEVRHGVGLLTFNRPEIMNAFRRRTQREVEDVLAAADGLTVELGRHDADG
jgi:enoyl-CoA hydratase/carnithine racemase